jgi:hypothetical protein
LLQIVILLTFRTELVPVGRTGLGNLKHKFLRRDVLLIRHEKRHDALLIRHEKRHDVLLIRHEKRQYGLPMSDGYTNHHKPARTEQL